VILEAHWTSSLFIFSPFLENTEKSFEVKCFKKFPLPPVKLNGVLVTADKEKKGRDRKNGCGWGRG